MWVDNLIHCLCKVTSQVSFQTLYEQSVIELCNVSRRKDGLKAAFNPTTTFPVYPDDSTVSGISITKFRPRYLKFRFLRQCRPSKTWAANGFIVCNEYHWTSLCTTYTALSYSKIDTSLTYFESIRKAIKFRFCLSAFGLNRGTVRKSRLDGFYNFTQKLNKFSVDPQ